jgi:hypothetical protein
VEEGEAKSDINIKLNDLQGLVKMFLNHKYELKHMLVEKKKLKQKKSNFSHIKAVFFFTRDELASF